MNQIFRISVGPETIEGKLPSIRVGRGYCSLFHITGVPADEPAPKVWVSTATETYYWAGEFDAVKGVWVVAVGNSITQEVGTLAYAITMTDDDTGASEYIAGQGIFTVYQNITTSGGEIGEAGTGIIARIEAIEAILTALADLPAFSTSAFDSVMRTQVESITNIVRTFGA